MSILPRSLAVVRNGVANILLSSDHSGRLYSADDVAGALNDGAAVDETPITARIGVTMLLRAFSPTTPRIATPWATKNSSIELETPASCMFEG